jgi:hypothetical protein
LLRAAKAFPASVCGVTGRGFPGYRYGTDLGNNIVYY